MTSYANFGMGGTLRRWLIMTGERLEYILKNYKKYLDAIDIQYDAYDLYFKENDILNVFELSKRYPFKEICHSMSSLKLNNSDLYNQWKLVHQLAHYHDILVNEKSAIRIEKRYDETYLNYNLLITTSIKQTKSLIDILIRS